MTVIPDLERKLVQAAERELTAAANPPRRPRTAGGRVGSLATAVMVGCVVAVTVAIGAGALVLLGGRTVSTGPGAPATARQALIASLAVLRGPQTAADRAFHQTGWPWPASSSKAQTQPDRRLIRLATITAWGAKVFIVPLTLSGRGRGEMIALWVQGIGWSDDSSLADVQSGVAFGPLATIHHPGGDLDSRFFEVVPDGVATVVFDNVVYNQRGVHPPRITGSVTATVHNNVAVFQDTGGTGPALARWYAADGRLIKRIGNSKPRISRTRAGAPVIKDCDDNGRLTRHFALVQIADALATMPPAVKKYTNCQFVLNSYLHHPESVPVQPVPSPGP